MDIADLKAKTWTLQIELTIPSVRKFTNNQKAFIQNQLKIAYLNGKMEGYAKSKTLQGDLSHEKER